MCFGYFTNRIFAGNEPDIAEILQKRWSKSTKSEHAGGWGRDADRAVRTAAPHVISIARFHASFPWLPTFPRSTRKYSFAVPLLPGPTNASPLRRLGDGRQVQAGECVMPLSSGPRIHKNEVGKDRWSLLRLSGEQIRSVLSDPARRQWLQTSDPYLGQRHIRPIRQLRLFLSHMASWWFLVIATEDSFTGPGQTILDGRHLFPCFGPPRSTKHASKSFPVLA